MGDYIYVPFKEDGIPIMPTPRDMSAVNPYCCKMKRDHKVKVCTTERDFFMPPMDPWRMKYFPCYRTHPLDTDLSFVPQQIPTTKTPFFNPPLTYRPVSVRRGRTDCPEMHVKNPTLWKTEDKEVEGDNAKEKHDKEKRGKHRTPVKEKSDDDKKLKSASSGDLRRRRSRAKSKDISSTTLPVQENIVNPMIIGDVEIGPSGKSSRTSIAGKTKDKHGRRKTKNNVSSLQKENVGEISDNTKPTDPVHGPQVHRKRRESKKSIVFEGERSRSKSNLNRPSTTSLVSQSSFTSSKGSVHRKRRKSAGKGVSDSVTDITEHEKQKKKSKRGDKRKSITTVDKTTSADQIDVRNALKESHPGVTVQVESTSIKDKHEDNEEKLKKESKTNKKMSLKADNKLIEVYNMGIENQSGVDANENDKSKKIKTKKDKNNKDLADSGNVNGDKPKKSKKMDKRKILVVSEKSIATVGMDENQSEQVTTDNLKPEKANKKDKKLKGANAQETKDMKGKNKEGDKNRAIMVADPPNKKVGKGGSTCNDPNCPMVKKRKHKEKRPSTLDVGPTKSFTSEPPTYSTADWDSAPLSTTNETEKRDFPSPLEMDSPNIPQPDFNATLTKESPTKADQIKETQGKNKKVKEPKINKRKSIQSSTGDLTTDKKLSKKDKKSKAKIEAGETGIPAINIQETGDIPLVNVETKVGTESKIDHEGETGTSKKRGRRKSKSRESIDTISGSKKRRESKTTKAKQSSVVPGVYELDAENNLKPIEVPSHPDDLEEADNAGEERGKTGKSKIRKSKSRESVDSSKISKSKRRRESKSSKSKNNSVVSGVYEMDAENNLTPVEGPSLPEDLQEANIAGEEAGKTGKSKRRISKSRGHVDSSKISKSKKRRESKTSNKNKSSVVSAVINDENNAEPHLTEKSSETEVKTVSKKEKRAKGKSLKKQKSVESIGGRGKKARSKKKDSKGKKASVIFDLSEADAEKGNIPLEPSPVQTDTDAPSVPGSQNEIKTEKTPSTPAVDINLNVPPSKTSIKSQGSKVVRRDASSQIKTSVKPSRSGSARYNEETMSQQVKDLSDRDAFRLEKRICSNYKILHRSLKYHDYHVFEITDNKEVEEFRLGRLLKTEERSRSYGDIGCIRRKGKGEGEF